MKPQLLIEAIWTAGAVQLAIIAANLPLPGMLEVRERFAGVPRFLCQIFYVHWIYLVIILTLFAAVCFSFAPQLAGASTMGRHSCAGFGFCGSACRSSITIAKFAAETESLTLSA